MLAPRVPVTIELDTHLYREPRDCTSVTAVGRMLKAGTSIAVVTVDLCADGEPLGVGTASFMAAPDATLTLPASATNLSERYPRVRPRLAQPFAERAGCERREPGVAVLSRTEGGMNSSNTINGGLIALVAEEAVLSAAPGTTLSSLAMRYLRPVRLGPAVGTAIVRGDVGHVEVRDAGSDDRLAVAATTRQFARAQE